MVLVAIRLFEVVSLKRARLGVTEMLRLRVRVVETIPLQSEGKTAYDKHFLDSRKA